MTDRLQQKAEQWVRERWGHPETTPLMLKQVFRSEIESYVVGLTAGIAMAAEREAELIAKWRESAHKSLCRLVRRCA